MAPSTTSRLSGYGYLIRARGAVEWHRAGRGGAGGLAVAAGARDSGMVGGTPDASIKAVNRRREVRQPNFSAMSFVTCVHQSAGIFLGLDFVMAG